MLFLSTFGDEARLEAPPTQFHSIRILFSLIDPSSLKKTLINFVFIRPQGSTCHAIASSLSSTSCLKNIFVQLLWRNLSSIYHPSISPKLLRVEANWALLPCKTSSLSCVVDSWPLRKNKSSPYLPSLSLFVLAFSPLIFSWHASLTLPRAHSNQPSHPCPLGMSFDSQIS